MSVGEYRGHRLLNARVWFEADDGTMRPGRQGLALRLECVPDFLEAIRTVTEAAAAAPAPDQRRWRQ